MLKFDKVPKGRKTFVLDIETSGLVAFRDNVEVITIKEVGKENIEFHHINKLRKNEKDVQFFNDLKERLKGSCIIGHNIAFDFGFLYYEGINIIEDNIYLMDTMVNSIIDRGDINVATEIENSTLIISDYYRTATGKFKKKHDLKTVIKYYLHRDIDKEMQKSDWTQEVLTEEQIEYAKNDVKYLEEVYIRSYKSIKKKGMLDILHLEENFITANIELNNNTLFVNKEKAQELLDELSEDIKDMVEDYNKIVLDKINEFWGGLDNFMHQYSYVKWENYNKNSKAKKKDTEELYIRKALRDMVKSKALISKDFDILIPKTKAVFKYFFNIAYNANITSTDKENIQILINKGNELAKLIKPLTANIKEYNDIVKALDNLTPDGRIVTSYRQLGAITGRLTSSGIGKGKEKIGLNIQQVNRDPRFRAIFEAGEGRQLVLADYSGMELRIIAGVTKEEKMLTAFRDGADLHSLTASNINMLPLDKFIAIIKDENHPLHYEYYQMRSIAKTMNFAIAYGAGAETIASRANIAKSVAEVSKNNYLTDNTSVKKYLDKQKAKQVVKSTLGRQMNTQSVITSKDYHAIKDWRRNTYIKDKGFWIANGYSDNFNYPIQSTGAEIVKLAIVRIINRDDYVIDKVKLTLQVHDEIALQVYEPLLEKWKSILQMEMESAGEEVMKGIITLTADANIGKNWNDAK